MHGRLGHLGGPLILAAALIALLTACNAGNIGAASATSAPADLPCPAPYDRAPFQSGWNSDLEVAGQSREVWVMPPAAGTPSPHPVLIAFNGTTEDGRAFAARARLQDFTARGFLVLAPSSAGNGELWPVWDSMRTAGREADPNPDIQLFDALRACAVSANHADPRRIYVAGHSAGGIFVNALVQRRSEHIAGAIVGSGVFSNTSPRPPATLDPLLVIVTWGGDNDQWTGRAGGVSVRDFSFVAESANASRYYASQPGTSVITCEGAELGHAWLGDINSWMIDQLLAHPKGQAGLEALPPTPAGARATCSAGPATFTPERTLTCPASERFPYCQDTCQLIADGAVLNTTVYPVLQRELNKLGFKDGDCGGCVRACEQAATLPVDDLTLACFHQMPDADPGVQGISGAEPLLQAINGCCDRAGSSGLCQSLCGSLKHNLVARPYLPTCHAQY